MPGAAAELAAHEERCAAAAAAGEEGAAERLAAARSWRAMLRGAGGDPALAAMFAVFAASDAAGEA